MAETFPTNLRLAVNDLIDTLVFKLVEIEDDDGIEEFISKHGLSHASDAAIREYASTVADERLSPWAELPLPSTFDTAIDELKSARGRLADHGIIDLQDAKNFSVGALVAGYMSGFEVNQQGWEGDTIDELRRTYIARFGPMLFLQTNVLSILIFALEAYRAQVKQAQEDVVRLVEDARDVVDSYSSFSCNGSDSKDAVFNIATTVVAVLGTLAAPEGFGPVAAALITGGLSIVKDEWDVTDPEPLAMGGDSVAVIWENILEAVETLRADFEAVETETTNIVGNFYSGLDGRVVIEKDNDGNPITVPATELIRLLPLQTNDIDAPDDDYTEPPDVYSPDPTC